MTSPAALLVFLGYRHIEPARFEAWYRQEHIPERLAHPGFLGVQRWVAPHQHLSFAWYELAALAALETPEYQAAWGDKFSPWTKEILAAVDVNRRYAATLRTNGTPSNSDATVLYTIEFTDESTPRWTTRTGDIFWYRVVDGPAHHLAIVRATTDLDHAELPDRDTARVTRFDRYADRHIHAVDPTGPVQVP